MSKRPSKTVGGQCPLCEATVARRLVTKNGCDVVRCTACGLVFVWPQPSAAELEALYSSPTYHAAVDEAERRRYFATRLKQVEELVPRRGRVLDVGCSQGLFLEAARAEGWDAVGIDLNRKAVAEAAARGLDVVHGELRAGRFESASFDVVTLFDLIEHVRQPAELLTACYDALRPGGLLMLTTPDVSGLLPRLTYVAFGLTLGAWGHPTPPAHLVQFSPRTVSQMLVRTGFEAVDIWTEHIPMAYSAGKLENSIVDVLAGRHRSKPGHVSTPKEATVGSAPGLPAPPPSRKSLLRKLLRTSVRVVAWSVVGPTALVARAARWGDSMRVAARRPL